MNLPSRKATGNNILDIVDSATSHNQRLCLLKRSDNGYPITVIDGKHHYRADTQDELVAAFGQVLSNPQTHLKFREFKNKINS